MHSKKEAEEEEQEGLGDWNWKSHRLVLVGNTLGAGYQETVLGMERLHCGWTWGCHQPGQVLS